MVRFLVLKHSAVQNVLLLVNTGVTTPPMGIRIGSIVVSGWRRALLPWIPLGTEDAGSQSRFENGSAAL